MQIEEDLLHYIKNELSEEAPDNLGVTDSLLDSGFLDSMSIVLLTEYIESHFQAQINVDDLTPENFETVAAIAAVIRAALDK